MRDESKDSGGDVPEGDGSKVETVVAGPLTAFLFKLDLSTKKKLFDIMEKRNHIVFTDAMVELINEEHERSIRPEDVVGERANRNGLARDL